MRPYKQYRVWQDSHALTLDVYELTRGFPREELFGLSSQMRRAASSVPMNIVEGSVKSDSEFRHALLIALGSAAELDYQFLLAHDLGYVGRESAEALTARVASIQRMLITFRNRIRQNDPPPTDSRRPIAGDPQ